MKSIVKNVYYVGVNDYDVDYFEGQFSVPDGMSYNSYLIIDEKIAVVDSVDVNFGEKWISNIKERLKGRTPDYLIVQHMEPDHSASIDCFVREFPEAKIVTNSRAKAMIDLYFNGMDFDYEEVKDGDVLNLGQHELSFISAPMVHWPEVMFTYDAFSKILFSADAFGKFGALGMDEDWTCEARRYYFGIVGKFGAQVQAVLKKVSALKIDVICPLHGPILTEDLDYYINLYNVWSSYGVENNGVVIAYTSVYGNTKMAVETLKDKLEQTGCKKVVVTDLVREDIYEAVEDAFRYGKLVLATTTYNGGIFPKMQEFIEHLLSRNYQNRTIGFIENGSWAPVAANAMKAMFEKSKNITFIDSTVKIRASMKEENLKEIEALADALVKN